MKKIIQSLKRKLGRLKGDPKLVARSFALGTFLGVTPFIGMQVILSIILSWVLHLSKAAAIVGVLNTNWTKGLILYPLNYKLGASLLGTHDMVDIVSLLHANPLISIQHMGFPIFLSLLIGGVITGSLLATAYYFIALRILQRGSAKATDILAEIKQKENKYALVTGASQGLGKQLAIELASKNIPLLLVSKKDEGLQAFSQELIQKFAVDVQFYETDFYERESVYEVTEWAVGRFPIFILINNAGLGGTRAFDQASPEYLDTIIQVNVRATSLLTRLLLPELQRHDTSYILNVASMASFSPFAYKTVYPASKAFVYSFSRGLHEELRGTQVHVSVIHPGPMKTNADVTARIDKLGIFGRMGLLSPEKIAHIAIRQIFKRDSLILPGFLNKLNWLFMRLLPTSWKLPVLSRLVRQEMTAGRNLDGPWALTRQAG